MGNVRRPTSSCHAHQPLLMVAMHTSLLMATLVMLVEMAAMHISPF